MPKFKECYSGMWLVGGVVANKGAKGVFPNQAAIVPEVLSTTQKSN
jgi:hypothetical protein